MGAGHGDDRRGAVILALLMCAALAATSAPAVASVLHSADTVETVDFEAYPVGTEITNQYGGITFEYPPSIFTLGSAPANGVVSSDVGGPPIVTSQGAHSGSQAGSLVPPGEFATAGTFAAFTNLASSVSLYVGDQAVTGSHYELDAYGADASLLGSDAAVTTATGAETLLTYSTGGAGTIAYVAIYRTDHTGNYGVIDDISFDVPPTSNPLVGVTTTSTTYELGQGGSRDLALTVDRLNGATGPMTLSVSGLPSEVTGTFSENPVASGDTSATLTLAAAGDAPVGNYQVTVSASASGATSQPPAAFTLSIISPLMLSVPAQLKVGGCTSTKATISVEAAPGVTGPVSFDVSTSSVSPGLSSSLSASQVALSEEEALTTLTVSSTGGTESGTVNLRASIPDGASSSAAISVQRLGPEVDRAGPLGGTLLLTPRALHQGTTLEIYGNYFCDSAEVSFGSAQATVTATVKHYYGNEGPYDYIRVQTPRLATTGPITVTAGSPSASGSSTGSVTVDSFRNVDAFNFHNFDPVLTFQDLTDAFGSQQTYVNFNPCGFLTLGLANCSVALVPDPVAAAWLAIAKASMAGGTCFGISLTDTRMIEGLLSPQSFPRTGGDLIYDLNGPPTDSQGNAQGSSPLLLQLKADHLQQLSTEFLNKWLTQASAQTVLSGSDDVSLIASEIKDIFAAGRYPMIELNDGNGGGGHVVVAYDLEPRENGGYNIYVYDNNLPFTSGEDTDGGKHANAVQSSVIDLEPNGTWQMPSTAEPDNAPFQGGPSAIVVTDPASIPVHPTLATLGGAAPSLLFSSAGTPGNSGAAQASSAAVTQVAAGGKTLYTSAGALNTNPSTHLDAARFAPFVGSTSGKRGPELTVIGPNVGPVDVSWRNRGSGPAAETFISGSFEASIQDAATPGTPAHGSFTPANGSVGYSGSAAAPVSLNIDRSTGTGPVDASITTSSGDGSDQLSVAQSGSVRIGHTGAPTTFELTLSSEPHNGLPATFTSGPISISGGQTATISGIHWGSLSSGTIGVKVGKRQMVLHNHAALAHLVSVRHVIVHQLAHHQVQVVVTGRLTSQSGALSGVVVWVIRSGKTVLAHHSTSLGRTGGPFSATWTVKLAPAKGLALRTEVLAVSEKGPTAAASTFTRSTTFNAS